MNAQKKKVHDKKLIKDGGGHDSRDESLAGMARSEAQSSDGGFSMEKKPLIFWDGSEAS